MCIVYTLCLRVLLSLLQFHMTIPKHMFFTQIEKQKTSPALIKKDKLENYLVINLLSQSIKDDVNSAVEILSSIITALPKTYVITIKEGYLGNSTHGQADWDLMEIILNNDNKSSGTYYLDGRKFPLNVIVLVHEILHIFGFGVGEKWDSLIKTRCSTYNGKNGVIQYKNLLRSRGYDVSKINTLLLENNFGMGTANAHLEEGLDDSFQLESGVFDGVDHPSLVNELMSGFLDGQDVITTVTLGILEDLGIQVNYASKYVNNFSKYLIIQSDTIPSTLFDSFVVKGYTFTGNDNFRTAISEWFVDESNATKKYGKIQDWDTQYVTDMSMLFKNRDSFNVNILGWNVQNVLSMKEMFWGASAFNHDIRVWKVNPLVDTTNMFRGATKINTNSLWINDQGYGTTPSARFFDNKILGYYKETAIDIYVSAGIINSRTPYRFYLDPEGFIELPGNKLYLRSTYRFHRMNYATSHPFYISDVKDTRMLLVTPPSEKLIFGGDGNHVLGISGSQTFTLRFATDTEERMMDTDSLHFYCTSHTSVMNSRFSLSYYDKNIIFNREDYKKGAVYHPDYVDNTYTEIKDYTSSVVTLLNKPSLSTMFDDVIQVKTDKMTKETDMRPGTIYALPTEVTPEEKSLQLIIKNALRNQIIVNVYSTPKLFLYDDTKEKDTVIRDELLEENIVIELPKEEIIVFDPPPAPAPAPTPRKRQPGYWFDTAYSRMISQLNLTFTIVSDNDNNNNK